MENVSNEEQIKAVLDAFSSKVTKPDIEKAKETLRVTVKERENRGKEPTKEQDER